MSEILTYRFVLPDDTARRLEQGGVGQIPKANVADAVPTPARGQVVVVKEWEFDRTTRELVVRYTLELDRHAKVCRNCTHWEASSCRRYPPTFRVDDLPDGDVEYRHPRTAPTDWCGEFTK